MFLWGRLMTALRDGCSVPVRPGEAAGSTIMSACTGGQLYNDGTRSLIADLLPLVAPMIRARGDATSPFCHPYELCTSHCAEEAGVVVTPMKNGKRRCGPH